MEQSEIETRFPNVGDHIEPGYRFSDLQVLQSAAGFYIGRMGWSPEYGGYEVPHSRESGYYRTEKAAAKALATNFEVRDCIENNAAYVKGTLPTPSGVMLRYTYTPSLAGWLHERGCNLTFINDLMEDRPGSPALGVSLRDAVRPAEDEDLCEVCLDGTEEKTPAVLRLLVGETDTFPHRAPLCRGCAEQSAEGQAALTFLFNSAEVDPS